MEISQKISLNDVYTFQSYTLKKKQIFKFVPVFLCVLAVGVVLCFISSEMAATGGLVIGLDVLFFIFILFLPKIQSKSSYHQLKNTEYKYIFEDEYLIIQSTNSVFEQSYKIRYIQIFEVIKLSKYFFIFTDSQQSYIINFSDLDKHSIEVMTSKLSMSLKYICDSNYKIKYRK